MSADMEKQIQSLLDGTLSDADRESLNDLLRNDAAMRHEFARQMKVHAMLQWRTGIASAALPEAKSSAAPKPRVLHVWRWAGWAAAAVFAMGFMLFFLSPNPATAAASQIIAAWERATDRTYVITVQEGDAWQSLKDDRRVGYEGARLHLSGRSKFVLVRPLDRGGEAITGSDGQSNWDIRGKGPVRVTTDSVRFRGGIPGEYQSVPFLDLGGLLDSLAADYDLTLSEDTVDPGLQRLQADKRNREKRGLPHMNFLFRKATGTVEKMELRGLPQEKGGPRDVLLTLVGETPFAPDFFTHQAHHEAGREVIVEPPQRNP